jgi:hypothetical protein
MFDSHQKSTGAQYTVTAALLIVAFVFCPLMLLLVWPLNVLSFALTLLCSTVCMSLACVWWNYSKLTFTAVKKVGVL